jgi:hypothetical protein
MASIIIFCIHINNARPMHFQFATNTFALISRVLHKETHANPSWQLNGSSVGLNKVRLCVRTENSVRVRNKINSDCARYVRTSNVRLILHVENRMIEII